MKYAIIFISLMLTSCLSPHFAPYRYDWFVVHDTVEGYWFRDVTTPNPIYIWQKNISGASLGDTIQLKEKRNGDLIIRKTVISKDDKCNKIFKFK
jgi:hypothetical protein